MQPAGGRVSTGRPESRSLQMVDRAARERNLDLILEEWKMPKRNAKSDHMQRKNPTWIASDGGEDG